MRLAGTQEAVPPSPSACSGSQAHAPALMNLLWIASEGGLACPKKAMKGKRNSCPPLLLSPCLGCWPLRPASRMVISLC